MFQKPQQQPPANKKTKEMNSPRYSLHSFLLVLLFSFPLIASANPHYQFIQCLLQRSGDPTTMSKLIYTPNNPSYSSVLDYTMQDLRFNNTSTPRPLFIVTPTKVSHIQAVVLCARKVGLDLRIRSGGHDYEGLSYISVLPFVILDMINMTSINVDVANKCAWVQAGATIGELYYKLVTTDRTLAFPAGVCASVGSGGHFSGGGYGSLIRKYGIAADHIIDAQIVDVNGRLLDRASMGEDVFWAIRGGGGNTYGVVVAWKINLVSVPSNVTVFKVQRTVEQNANRLVYLWQTVANEAPDDLFILGVMGKTNSSQVGSTAVNITFFGDYLGGMDDLLQLMKERFPELGVVKEDCTEMSWQGSNLFLTDFPANASLQFLLSRSLFKVRTKAKADYVKEPIPEAALDKLWKMFYEVEVGFLYLAPYGGIMNRIPETSIPYSHRAEVLYQIGYFTRWDEDSTEIANKHIKWMRKLYKYMAPYVSKNPRSAYINYRDLDIGVNDLYNTSYQKASIWGRKYFGINFDRLVKVKTEIDPSNFFRNEQSIPPLVSW
ncbi:hypothetical protein K2173_001780 [Erythroxylum novogranatense]|uniref:FAD-binding PCMH-type domain-containing protein n=1 Tax=Erythroxylum novogranatense TaxID=1862640 RepID=A0AAV8SJ87_9ROSI|nr:hypothetical protein K2173_001780 [Erythroxylum novogranatense]